MKSENTVQQKKKNESSPKKQLNYSFTKEFINTISVNSGQEEDEKNVILAKSHFGLGALKCKNKYWGSATRSPPQF